MDEQTTRQQRMRVEDHAVAGLDPGDRHELVRARLGGHRIGIEGIWTVHEESDGPQLASDWGFVIGWQKEFGLGAALGGAMPF